MIPTLGLNKILTWAIVGGTIYIAVLVIYRLAFHPLRKYPGPVLAKITDWYPAFYVWRGSIHCELFSLHQKYGEIVRFGPNSISINSKTGLSEIYGVRANVQKTQSYAVMSASRRTSNTISCRDKKNHSFKRKILAQVFTDQALKGVEDRILTHIRRFCDELGRNSDQILHTETLREDEWSSSHDIAVLSDYLAFDIISSLCYGKSFDMLGSTNLRHITSMVSTISRRNAICFVQPMVWKFKLDHIFLAALSFKVKSFSAMIKDLAKKRTELGCNIEQKDCFYYMLNAKDPKTGKGLSNKELWCESLQLIIAGSDTTGMAISAAFFYLLHSPEALRKASQEVRSHFSSVEEIRVGSQLNACKYLHACLKEALRMSPSVTGLAPREVLAGGLTVDENHFPQGVTIGTPIYTIHHNEAYFPEPFIYRPERWIVDPDKGYTEESVRLAQSAFCPFSIGSRSCVAKNLAWMEISITLARTLYLYDMRLSPEHAHKPSEGCISPTKKGHGFEYLLKGWMTSARLGPQAQFRRVCEMNGTQYVI